LIHIRLAFGAALALTVLATLAPIDLIGDACA
jgi:hypothetical protein